MKKIYFLTLLLFTCIGAYSQDKRFTFGIKGGWINSTTKDAHVRLNHRNGITVGGFTNFKLNTKFSLQAEVLYTQKGFHHESDYYDHDGKPLGRHAIRYSSDYIEIPVFAKFKFKERVIVPYIFTGISTLILLQEKVRYPSYTSNGMTEITSIHDRSGTNNYSLAWTSGVGIEYKHILLEARPSFTFMSLDYVYATKFKSISLMAGYRF